MIGLLIAVIIFNFAAFKTNKNLTGNLIVHIWSFTVAFQVIFDVLIEFKYHGYWYFEKEIDWRGLIPHMLLIPPVNMLFLNWFPFKSSGWKKLMYLFLWVIAILIYEWIALLPEPWGYFHYGWWNLMYAVIVDPILFLILLGYYKWVYKLEKKAVHLAEGNQ
ncbi:hypothetical protein [Bacillus massilinigeriensis]|uniref:hypothetical protein n=1 Tax=Bacillus massilionigeriensis TaxID=1805475 RepID=UPI00096B0ABB|nr:hypothetical protein [Bacillus massilionigeriensis]